MAAQRETISFSVTLKISDREIEEIEKTSGRDESTRIAISINIMRFLDVIERKFNRWDRKPINTVDVRREGSKWTRRGKKVTCTVTYSYELHPTG